MADPLPVYGMGNPLLDISADVTPDFLKGYGLRPSNAILAEPQHLPMYDELAAMEGCVFIAGGATLNSMRVCQWMHKPRQTTCYVGCVGDDQYGKTLREAAEKEGVQMLLQTDPAEQTGTCAVCIVARERSMVANLGAANAFKADHVKTDAVSAAISRSGIYYCSGFFLTVSPPALMEVAGHAAANNKIFCINIAAPFIIAVFGEVLADAIRCTDIVFGNDDECEIYGKTNNIAGSKEEVAVAMAKLPKENAQRPRAVIITCGKDPTIIATPDGVEHVEVARIPAEDIIDTNGAGDAFVGGFLSQLALGRPLRVCALAGHYTAGEVIRRSGCTFPEQPSFQLPK